MVPFFDTLSGLTPATLGCVEMSATAAAIAVFAEASPSVAVLVAKTTWADVPDCEGKRWRRTSSAFCDSTPGTENLFDASPPATLPRTVAKTAKTTQTITTRRRLRTHHRPSRYKYCVMG